MDLTNKVALITGAASGFGKELTKLLIARGSKVVLADINEADGKALADSFNSPTKVASFIRCDLSQVTEVQRIIDFAIAEFGSLDIVVNNAGISPTVPWIEQSNANTLRLLAINLTAPIEGTRVAVRYFLQNKRPGIVLNVASIAWRTHWDTAPIYTASKAGLVAFTRSCESLAGLDSPVRVNVVAPHMAATNIHPNVNNEENARAQGVTLLSAEEVAVQMLRVIEDESRAGDLLEVIGGREPEYVEGPRCVTTGGIPPLVAEHFNW